MMKRIGWISGLLLAVLLVPAHAQRVLHVQVRTTPVRQAASFLGAPVAELAYGDRVHAAREQGPWIQVRLADGAAGWVHTSAVTRQRVRLHAGEEDAAATATGDEIAIAGKGFNEQVEAEFRAGDARVDYAWVDRVETRVVSPEDIRQFMVSGGLRDPAEGGVK